MKGSESLNRAKTDSGLCNAKQGLCDQGVRVLEPDQGVRVLEPSENGLWALQRQARTLTPCPLTPYPTVAVLHEVAQVDRERRTLYAIVR